MKIFCGNNYLHSLLTASHRNWCGALAAKDVMKALPNNNKPDRETRLSHYKQVLAHYQRDVYTGEIGMCYVFAELFHGSFPKAPWTFFYGLNEYYPELTEPDIYFFENQEIQERVRIIKSAIEKLSNP